ncbi:MAG: hypothetical protein JXR97_01765 [Planctomycetes bacterium]|nr:hypothetical protein [Planctomycetota bacterium]
MKRIFEIYVFTLALVLLAFAPQSLLAQDAAVADAPAKAVDEKQDVAKVKADDDEDDEEEEMLNGDEVVSMLKKHFVRVKIWVKKDDGEMPMVYNFASDLGNEKPTFIGGYLWDEKTVVMEDFVLHDRFIRSIEVEAGGKSVPAKIKGYLKDTQAVLLELNESLPGVEPIKFCEAPEREDIGSLRGVKYFYQQDGNWCTNVSGAVAGFSKIEGKKSYLWGAPGDLLIMPDGQIAGLSFSGKISSEGDDYIWEGADLRKDGILTLAEKVEKHAEIKARLAKAALLVKIDFRAVVEEENQNNGFHQSWNMDRQGINGNDMSEIMLTGFLIGESRLLVPTSLNREMIARIEAISVSVPGADGKAEVLSANFSGALNDWEAILIDVEGRKLEGFLDFANGAEFAPDRMFLKSNVNYWLKERKERLSYDRFVGYFRGYKDMPAIWTHTNEDDGSLAFSLDGKLLAISLAQRTKTNNDYNAYAPQPNSAFRPVALVSGELAKDDAVDLTMKPLAKEKEKLSITLGVESQNLDLNLARVFNVEKDTRGGAIGRLVLYVYPGSPAAKAGLEEKDILLRIKDPDRTEPIDIGSGYGMYGRNSFMSRFDDYDDFGGDDYYGPMQAPWPSRQNAITAILSGIGENKKINLEFIRNGEKKSVSITTQKGRPDFSSAKKFKSKELGFTVKELTYEVRRFFKREDEGGVVVSKVEPGSKAMVGGMLPYNLVTHMNGKPVTDFNKFKAAVEALQPGSGTSVEFTLEYMGKTRLVKIEM